MLDLHSGNEYGAARIAAMIAAAVTIVLTVLAAFGSMVPYAQADSFGALTINAVWGRDTASPKSLAGDTYSIVRVATVTTNNDGSVSSYKTVGDFSGLTADWERLTSSEYHDAAKKLAARGEKQAIPAFRHHQCSWSAYFPEPTAWPISGLPHGFGESQQGIRL